MSYIDIDSHKRFVLRKGHARKCAAVMVTNLAEPYYVVSDCYLPALVNVLCLVPISNISKVHQPTQLKADLNLCVCSKTAVLRNTSCFSFEWQENVTSHQPKCYQRPQDFANLFAAVQVSRFPPFLLNENASMRFARFYNVHSFSFNKTEMFVNYLCIFQAGAVLRETGENVFQNNKGEYISVQLVCHNNTNDNPRQSTTSDSCICSGSRKRKLLKTCQYISDSHNNKTCSPLYNKTAPGECRVYINTDENTKKISLTSNAYYATFLCSQGDKIHREMINDLEEDCPDGSDEPVLNMMFLHHIYHFCAHSYQIPCREGHSRCFNISQICTYNLNPQMNLQPCRTGEHLQLCKHFTCNAMFKCEASYCIPWKFTCDGRINCPLGTDELTEMCALRNCKQLFKCKSSHVCIHLRSICDGIFDCPHQEDEILCHLNDAVCPRTCTCLSVAVHCDSTQIRKDYINKILSFSIVLMKNCQLHHQLFLSSVLMLSITFSNLTEVCAWIEHESTLRSIDVGFNCIEHLFVDCFGKTRNVQLIDLKNNHVSTLKTYVFRSLLELNYVSLSCNPLQNVASYTFYEVPNLQHVSMFDVFGIQEDRKFLMHLDLEVVDTNDVYMCCFLPFNVQCSVHLPWYISCTRLLKMSMIRIILYTVSTGIVILNSASIVLCIYCFKKKLEKSSAFTINIVSINLGDETCAAPLCMLWVTDLVWTDSIFLLQTEWRSGMTCHLIFGIFLGFSFLSVSFLDFFTLSRFILTKYPLNLSMKQGYFVFKVNVTICTSCFFFACTFTLLKWLIDLHILQTEQLSFICYPFPDTSTKMLVTKMLIYLTATLQLTSLVVVFVLYVLIFFLMKRSREAVGKAKSREQSHTVFFAQLVVILMSHSLCWIPSSTIHMLSMFLAKYPVELTMWTVAAIYPITAIVNPILFVVLSLRKFKIFTT